MKKIISISLIIMLSFIMCFTQKCFALNIAPEYDATFNNNAGVFFANGNDITIKKDNNNTVVYWNGGSQVVPETVTIVGGGKEDSNIENTNILMEDGIVSNIYGGGISLDENRISKVKNANISITGGKVKNTVAGGGLLFTSMENVQMNIYKGDITAICGGGMAAATISGVTYAAGTEGDLINSKNRTINTIVNINGDIDSLNKMQMIFGGGQGYSYTENVELNINGGHMNNAYVTAGGSNGYTKNSNVNIRNGNILVLQTVNRGKVEKVDLNIEGGNIERAYIAGETEDPTVTGVIDKVDFKVLGGNVQNLASGKSNNIEIGIDQNNYKVVAVKGKVINDKVAEEEKQITYNIEIIDRDINLKENDNKKLNIVIKTEPAGYEYLFENEKCNWQIEKNEIASIDEDGIVYANNRGSTIVTVRMLDKLDSTIITVGPSMESIIQVLVIITIFSIILAILSIIALLFVWCKL